jgi:hypothetical protein
VTVYEVATDATVGVPLITPVDGSSERPDGRGDDTANVALPVRATVGDTGVTAVPTVPVMDVG